MEDDDGGWGDLFAKASGQQEASAAAPPLMNSESSDEPPQKSRKKRKNSKQRKHESQEAFQKMIKSRGDFVSIQPVFRLPLINKKWARLGGSMSANSSNTCDCYRPQSRDPQLCVCQTSPYCHRLDTDDSDTLAWPLKLFCCLRNLRCCGGLVARASTDEKRDCWMRTVSDESSKIIQFMKQIQGHDTLVMSGEAALLQNKCDAVIRAANDVDRSSSSSLFDEAVRLMIACDKLYYRLYYLQITGCFHAEAFLPHPTEYFGTPYLACVSHADAIPKMVDTLVKDVVGQDDARQLRSDILSRYCPDGNTRDVDPLMALHRHRLCETISLFSETGWNRTDKVTKQWEVSLVKPIPPSSDLSYHDTPAPAALSEWRDSCRDPLCNIYAYATLDPSAASRIKGQLESLQITKGVIEIGAGTGYIAALLQKTGINVIALDSHPTAENNSSDANEYHGRTPSYALVQKGRSGSLQQHMTSPADYALMLCYPPPQSQMAKGALQSYVDLGGRSLIHIGEFRGLTGSTEFETLLQSRFECVERFPCLAWGTDAAEVSIWRKRDPGTPSPSLLLPCSNCQTKEANRRCRLARFIVYCSEDCFLAHTNRRQAFLGMGMINANVANSLNYHNEHQQAMVSLRQNVIKGSSATW